MSKTYESFFGRTGKDPEFRDTKAGKVAKFSLAVKTGYGEGDTRWINVAAFNEGLQARLRNELPKGSKCVVQGWLEEDNYGGQSQWNLVADEIGLVELFTPTRKGQKAPAATAQTGAYSDEV